MLTINKIKQDLRNRLFGFFGKGAMAQLRLRVASLERSRHAIINAMPGNVALFDAEGAILAVNDAWRLHIEPNDLPDTAGSGIGKHYRDVCRNLTSGDSVSSRALAAGISDVLDGNAPTFSTEYLCSSQTEQNLFRLTASPIGLPHVDGLLVVHANVSATKEVEASLSATEIYFRQMAENIHDVFFLADTQSKKILYISPAYEEIFGLSCASMYADRNAWLAVVSPEDRVRIRAEYCSYKKTSSVRFDDVFNIVRPDQVSRWIALKVFSIRDETGKVTRITGVAQDITERKNAARVLQESEFRLRELLNSVGLISVMVDREEKITFCNEALSLLTGWRHEEIIGRNWFDLFMPNGSVDTRQHYATLLSDQPEKGRHENRIKTRSGETRAICWTSSIMHSPNGEVVGVAGIGEDVTDQEREAAKILQLNANLEKLSIRLIQAQEQERINLARELHDELGQRLALLKIDLHQLRRVLVAPEAIGIWDNVDAAIISLIGQIRVISVSLRPPALDYLGLESAIRQLLNRQFANSTTTCVFEYVGLPPKLDPTIEIAVYRIVQECITNIIRHAEAGRVVIEINGGESGTELELIVRDNGSGFDPTASADTVMPKGGISGSSGSSGLLGMRERVELLGGAFSAETAVGQGTRIMASLPLKSHA